VTWATGSLTAPPNKRHGLLATFTGSVSGGAAFLGFGLLTTLAAGHCGLTAR
jgi:hypothetical protein